MHLVTRHKPLHHCAILAVGRSYIRTSRYRLDGMENSFQCEMFFNSTVNTTYQTLIRYCLMWLRLWSDLNEQKHTIYLRVISRLFYVIVYLCWHIRYGNVKASSLTPILPIRIHVRIFSQRWNPVGNGPTIDLHVNVDYFEWRMNRLCDLIIRLKVLHLCYSVQY